MMNWLPVESKMLTQIGYDQEAQVLGAPDLPTALFTSTTE
jgi:hypothetical protein